ncbi:MAG: TonB family protein [Saprospiraceae bacterium]|nr:TonB family protein [Saprospiraceae bacterium]
MTLENTFFKQSRPFRLWYMVGLLLFLARSAAAQDTLYFDKNFEPAGNRANAIYREIRECDSVETKRCTVTTSLTTGAIISVVRYSDYPEGIRDGLCSFYFANGKPCLETEYQNGHWEGNETSYYPSGQLKSKEFRKGGRVGFGNYYHPDGSAKTEISWEEIKHLDLIRPVRFRGEPYIPQAYLRSALHFPRSALRDGQPELAILSFVVEKNGSISSLKIVTPTPSQVLNKEALRVVANMGKWEPHQVNGVPERNRFLFPVLFE